MTEMRTVPSLGDDRAWTCESRWRRNSCRPHQARPELIRFHALGRRVSTPARSSWLVRRRPNAVDADRRGSADDRLGTSKPAIVRPLRVAQRHHLQASKGRYVEQTNACPACGWTYGGLAHVLGNLLRWADGAPEAEVYPDAPVPLHPPPGTQLTFLTD